VILEVLLGTSCSFRKMIEIKIGDCTQRLKDIETNSVDSIISDPPYGLKFMSKGWDDIGEGSQQREWHREWLREAYRVLKPNGVLKAFSGSRTFHHLIYMMEGVGFRDLSVEAWVYGSGFPKGHNISKQFDKRAGVQREVIGSKVGLPGYSLAKDKGRGVPCVAYGNSEKECEITAPSTDEAKLWDGWGTALKPAWEPICIGYKR